MAQKVIIGVGIPQNISKTLREHFNSEIFRFIEFSGAEELINNIKKYKTDLIFLYNVLPDLRNYQELCIALRADSKLETVPIIVISQSNNNSDEKIKMLNSGLIDGFVNSLITPEELIAYANIFLQRRALEKELELKNKLLNKLSVTDELTKLYNRRYLIQAIEQEIQRIKRYDYPLSCIMLDIDHYKDINDKLGHSQGDAALEKLAELVRNNIRSVDIPCRYGGDEIVLILPFTDLESAYIMAEKLRKKVQDYNFGSTDNPLKFTISIGLVSIEAKYSLKVSADSLFQALDKKLYEAKNAGRNKICGDLFSGTGKKTDN